MGNLVTMEGKQALTTSLKVAETFGKEHRHVLRDIKVLIEQMTEIEGKKDMPKFGHIFYDDSYGRKQTAYIRNENKIT